MGRPWTQLLEDELGGPGDGQSGGKASKGGGQIGLEIQKLLQANQLHGLGDPQIAHHQERLLVGLALLGKLHKGSQTGGVDEIDLGKVDHQWMAATSMGGDEITELFVGVGVQLAREAKQLAVGLLFKSSTQGNR